jgi:Fur family ferric uptake transcriptional regulator
VQQIKNMMGEILNFEVTSHSLNLYGNCAGGCEKTKKP